MSRRGSKRHSPNADVTAPMDRSASTEALPERTIAGLHRYVATRLPSPTGGARAVDLGAGSGAFSRRLEIAGWSVESVDQDSATYAGDVPLHQFDLNASAWPLDGNSYQLVAALEVIEHIRDPIGFLTKIAGLLDEHGLAVVSTPNLDSLASRLRFLLTGTLRQMDESGDPTHISPIFMDLLERRYLPAAHLTLERRLLYPPKAHLAVRPSLQRASGMFGRFLPSSLMGDTNIFFLHRAEKP